MRVDPDRGRRQPATPASPHAADSEVDILEVREEGRIEAADLEKCGAVESRRPTARRERVEDTDVQDLDRLAVKMVEAVEAPIDDDACRVDQSLVAEANEDR